MFSDLILMASHGLWRNLQVSFLLNMVKLQIINLKDIFLGLLNQVWRHFLTEKQSIIPFNKISSVCLREMCFETAWKIITDSPDSGKLMFFELDDEQQFPLQEFVLSNSYQKVCSLPEGTVCQAAEILSRRASYHVQLLPLG